MRRVALVLAVAAFGAVVPATANAASLTITPPASPPSEDSGFPIVVSGTAAGFSDSDAELIAKIRPAGAPCAPSPSDDSGETIWVRLF